MKMPSVLEYYTADQVAETIDFDLPTFAEREDLYIKLWRIQIAAKSATPLGGDGTNGTVEHPSERMDLDNDDKAAHWWHQLTETEQGGIARAVNS